MADRPSGGPVNDLSVDIADHVAIVEIHRPPANFFDVHLVTALADTYAKLDADPACRAIVLCSEGKHFCAGADFSDRSRAAGGTDTATQLYAQAVRLFLAATPVVAAIQGAAIGGGLGLALSADFRVGAVTSRFAANFSQLGFHPGFGISVTLPLVVGRQRALDYVLTGRRVTGEEAFAAGLLDRLVDDGQLRRAATDFAAQIAAAAPLAIVRIRRTMRAGLAEQVAASTEHEAREQATLRATADFQEGIAASAQRRPPIFAGE